MKVQLECTYCGHIWTKVVYGQDSLQREHCTHGNCRERKLVFKDLTNKIDYYQGAPAFPVKTGLEWSPQGMY